MSDAQSTATTAPAAARDGAAGEVLLEVRDGLGRITPVSYTHLTLPTIYSV